MHVLVIGQQGMILSMEEVDVPYTQQSQQDGGVLVQGSSAEVVVLKQRNVFISRSTYLCLYSTCDEMLKDLPSNELPKEAFQSCQNLMMTQDTTEDNFSSFPALFKICNIRLLLLLLIAIMFLSQNSISEHF